MILEQIIEELRKSEFEECCTYLSSLFLGLKEMEDFLNSNDDERESILPQVVESTGTVVGNEFSNYWIYR